MTTEKKCPKCGEGVAVFDSRGTYGSYEVCRSKQCDYYLMKKEIPETRPEGVQLQWDRFGGYWKQPSGKSPVVDGYVNKCRHWRQKVKVGSYTVTCSSYISGNGLDPKPDFGVYLSTLWKDRLGDIWTNGAYLVDQERPYPAVVIDWPDQGAVGNGLLERIVDLCWSKMRHGKAVDIGCHGGHGRTGTLLAALIIKAEHISGEQAIKEVRVRYCKMAIETKTQENAIKEYARKLAAGC